MTFNVLGLLKLDTKTLYSPIFPAFYDPGSTWLCPYGVHHNLQFEVCV